MKLIRLPFLIALIVLILSIFTSSKVEALSTLYFTSPSKSVSEGDKITLSLKVNSAEDSINAISGKIVFPEDLLKPLSVSKEKSIISLWTVEPSLNKNNISFEGVILNPGFIGNDGLVLRITFEAKKRGVAYMNFVEGSVLANDGLGTNILSRLQNTNFDIVPRKDLPKLTDNSQNLPIEDTTLINDKIVRLPKILELSQSVSAKEGLSLYGVGEPNSITKIVFKDISLKSFGEELFTRIQTKKTKLENVLVENDQDGNFSYSSKNNLVAGVYNATPFLVDENNNIEKPGIGKQFLVNDSKLVKNLIILINVLVLVIPIVLLLVLIYFIPWYSWLKMKVLKKKIEKEEEQIEFTENHTHNHEI